MTAHSQGSGTVFAAAMWDYYVYKTGSLYKAKSRDPAYDSESGSSLATVLNAALTNRATVGGKYFLGLFGVHSLSSMVSVPTDDARIDWDFEGLGEDNTVLEGAAGIGAADSLFECARTGWAAAAGSDPYVFFRKMHLDPNNLGLHAVNMPYTYFYMDHMRIKPDIPNGGSLIAGGGSAGGTLPCGGNVLTIDPVGYDRDIKTFDLWYDSFNLAHLIVNITTTSATQDILEFDGENYSIGHLDMFLDHDITIHDLIHCNSVYLYLGTVNLVAHSTGGQAVAAFIEADAGSRVRISEFRDGVPCTAKYHDDTTRKVVIDYSAGGEFTFLGGGDSNLATDGTDQYLTHSGWRTPTTGESNVSAPVPQDCIITALYVKLMAAPNGAGKTRTFTVRNNGAPGNLTVTLTNAETTGSDTTHTDVITAGNTLNLFSDGGVNAPDASQVLCQIRGHWL